MALRGKGDMQPTYNQPERNRRLQRRRFPRSSAQVVRHANAMGLGPNVAKSLLDLSESGAQLLVTVEMMQSQEVELELCSVNLLRPIKIIAEAVLVRAGRGVLPSVGLRFRRLLDLPGSPSPRLLSERIDRTPAMPRSADLGCAAFLTASPLSPCRIPNSSRYGVEEVVISRDRS